MTRLEKIKSMSKEELISSILLSGIDVGDLNVRFCSQFCPNRNKCFSESDCDTADEQILSWWLDQEV